MYTQGLSPCRHFESCGFESRLPYLDEWRNGIRAWLKPKIFPVQIRIRLCFRKGGRKMSMTKSRREVYRKSWYDRECKVDKRLRRREYNRKVRHMKIDEDACSRDLVKSTMNLCWNTMS